MAVKKRDQLKRYLSRKINRPQLMDKYEGEKKTLKMTHKILACRNRWMGETENGGRVSACSTDRIPGPNWNN